MEKASQKGLEREHFHAFIQNGELKVSHKCVRFTIRYAIFFVFAFVELILRAIYLSGDVSFGGPEISGK